MRTSSRLETASKGIDREFHSRNGGLKWIEEDSSEEGVVEIERTAFDKFWVWGQKSLPRPLSVSITYHSGKVYLQISLPREEGPFSTIPECTKLRTFLYPQP